MPPASSLEIRASRPEPDSPKFAGVALCPPVFGWLTRGRRIRLGKRIIANCEAGRDGDSHNFPHVQPSRGTASVYLVTSLNRPERVNTLQNLVAYAQMKY